MAFLDLCCARRVQERNPKDSSAWEPLPEVCPFLVQQRISGPLLMFIASSSLLAILPL